MDPVLAQWLPVIVMIIAIWVGLLYNNNRLDDFKDLLRAEVGAAKAELRTEILQSKTELQVEFERSKAEIQGDMLRSERTILQAIAEMKAELKADIQGLDRRLQRLEAPLLRTQ